MALAPALILLACALPARARGTPQTVWDQIFASQSARLMREGVERLAEGDYDQAVRALARAVVTAPEEPLARILLGSAYYWQGQVEQALQEYREALSLDPRSAQAHQLIGIAHAWKGDIEAAHASFSEAARLAPERPDIRMNLGSVEQARGRLGEALDHFRSAVKGEGAHPLYRYQLGMLYVRMGRVAEAQEELEASLRLYPAYQDALLELGALREREGDLEGAVSRYRRAVKLKPHDAAARFRLSAALLKKGRPEEARKVLGEAFHASPSSKGGRLALSVAFGGKPAGEAAAGGETPPGGSDGADPADFLARTLARLPAGREAKVELQLAFLPPPRLELRQPEDLGKAPSGLGRALGKRLAGDREVPMVAKREFLLPADGPQRQEQVSRMVREIRSAAASLPPGGRVHMGLNVQFKPSQAENGASLHYEPRRIGNDLGLWVVGTGWMGLVEEALPELQESARGASLPADGPVLLTLGLGHLALGRSQEAREAFERVAEANPGEVLAHLGRAAAWIESGEEPAAAEAYRRVLALDPGNDSAEEALRWMKP